MSAVSAGKPFSQAVREAVELGYAEPDPRDDLTGPRCRAQGADPRAAARLSRRRRRRRDDLVPRALEEAAARRVHGSARRQSTTSGRRASRAEAAQRPRAALRRDGDAARRVGEARRRCRRRARSARSQGTRNLVAFTTRRYSHRAARHQRPGRRRRGHGGRHPERHLLALGALSDAEPRTLSRRAPIARCVIDR